jgi:adenylate cyclase
MLPEGLKTLNRGLQFRKLPTINLRIGINTGNLIQGNIGSEDRKDWTVVGDVVNTAYRIEEATEPGQILISEDTIGRLQRPEDYRFIKELSLKGKSTRIRVFSPR